MTDRTGKFIRTIPTRVFSGPILTLVIAFIISRIGIYLVKPFLFNPINYYWQYLDPVILKNDLWRGLYYLHSQPPLFNLYLGLVLKIIPPEYVSQAFSFMYFFMGLGIILSSYYLMRCLEIPVKIALIISLVFLFSPAMIKAERWLFYTYPLTLAMTLSAIPLYKFVKENRTIHFLLLVMVITAIVLTRSFFHAIFWMIPILIMVFFLGIDRNRKHYRLLVAASLFFLILANSIYLKNYVMFGNFTSSTWQGMNFAGMTSYVEKV